jgi:hypothetical protein
MKISYTQLLNIVLVTILATSLLFMNTKSTIEPKTASAGTYDPWLDYNEDGYIGIDDIFSTASSFAAEGDPTKNVNITNWDDASPKLRYEVLNLGMFNLSNRYETHDVPPIPDTIFCGGYSKIAVMYTIYDAAPGDYSIDIWLKNLCWSCGEPAGWFTTLEWVYLLNTTVDHASGMSTYYPPPPAIIETKGSNVSLTFATHSDAPNWADLWIRIEVSIYLRSD